MANLATYSDIIEDIKDKFNEKSVSFGSDTETSIRKWISQVEFDIYGERKWPFLQATGSITTVASTQEYDLASDFSYGGLINVYDETSQKSLDQVNVEDLDEIYPGQTTTGNPRYFYLWGADSDGNAQIGFFPIPSSALTIKYRYYKDPTPTDISTDISNDSESPLIPRRYRKLLVDAVLEELMQKDVDPNADRASAKYQLLLAKMVRDYGQQPSLRVVRRSEDGRRMSEPSFRLPSNYPPI